MRRILSSTAVAVLTAAVAAAPAGAITYGSPDAEGRLARCGRHHDELHAGRLWRPGGQPGRRAEDVLVRGRALRRDRDAQLAEPELAAHLDEPVPWRRRHLLRRFRRAELPRRRR